MNYEKTISVGLLLCALLVSAGQSAEAQKVESSSSSSKPGHSSGVSGVVGKEKTDGYPKTIETLKAEVAALHKKGRLTGVKAFEFDKRLTELQLLVKNAEAKKWTEDSKEDLDKRFKEFNDDLSAQARLNRRPPSLNHVPGPTPLPVSHPTNGHQTQWFTAPHNQNALDDAPAINFRADQHPGRRPNVGGGDTKPTGAAGKGN